MCRQIWTTDQDAARGHATIPEGRSRCHCHLLQRKSRCDCIQKDCGENALGKGAKISDNEIEFLLKSNSGDTPWKKRSAISMNREWESENSNLFATYITFENLLMVATQDYLAREKAKKNAQEGKTLDGF